LSSTRPANHHRAKPADDSAGQPLNRVFERHTIAAHVDTKRNDPNFQRDLRASVERAQRLLAAMDTGADE
jgi:hypothetical protein